MSRFSYALIFTILTAIVSPSAFASELMQNTYVGGVYQNFTGDRENSLVGAEGYGLTVISTPHKSHFRLLYGAMLSMADGRAYVDGTRYGATVYSADAMVGFSIYPITTRVPVRPFLEVAGLGGFKYMELVSAPTTVDSQSTGLSYGYRLGIGLETNLSHKYGLRMTADYINNRANIVNASAFQFDSFAFSLGIFF